VRFAASSRALWPSVARWPLVGHVPTLIREGLIPLLERSWRSCGDCFELQVGGQSLKFIVHPDDVEAMLLGRRERYIKGVAYDQFRQIVGQGLVSSEGELWRRERRIIQPCFRRETIAGLGDRMLAQTDATLDRWARGFAAGEVFDIHAEFMRLALEIIGDCLFDLEFGEVRTSVSTRAFSEAIEVISDRLVAVAVPPRWLPTPANIRLARSIAALDRVVAGVIATRRREREGGREREHGDLLDTLLDARDHHGEPLDEIQLRDEVVTMFLAGHETTAVALTWTWWLLSQHREVLARAGAEVEAALGGRRPSAADLPKLGYLAQIVHESMRLIPPVWSGARDCIAADTLGPGLPVAPGDRVINAIFLTHKHPEFWTDPERFDPERFAPQAATARHKFAYMPFSEGPRKCVGLHFASMEAQLVLARLLQRGRLEIVEGFVPEFDYQLTVRPKHGVLARWTPK
jgi:cytochrome P450